MNTHKFMVEKVRFHLDIPDTLIFVGWFYDGRTINHTLTVDLDGTQLQTAKLVNKGSEVCQKYTHSINEINEEVVGIVKLPKDWRNGHKLSIQSTYQGKPHRDAVYSVKTLQRLENKIDYCIEHVKRTGSSLVVNGWCLGNGELKLSLLDTQKQPLPAKIDHFYKTDPERVGPEDEKRDKLFFSLKADSLKQNVFFLEIRSAKSFEQVRLDKWNTTGGAANLLRRLKKALRYLKSNGIKATLVKISSRLAENRTDAYTHWRKKYEVTAAELEEQKSRQAEFKISPKFSIAVPLYRTDEVFLRELIASVQNQTYTNWELCLADGSEDNEQKLAAIISGYQSKDPRIRYRILEKNYGISQNMNEAMQMAAGDFILPVDHDDTLSPNALFEFAKAVNENPSVDVIYSDEDKIDLTGTKFSKPHFKPDYDLDFLLTNNYICHLLAVRRELVNHVGGFRSEYDGSQDYDFILRCCEAAKGIYHVPKILYHWRCHYDSTAANPQSKLYAFEAGRRAVEAHYQRLGIPAEAEHAQFHGLYRTRYHWKETPLVSVIIPNGDSAEKLAKCVESVLWSDYANYEIIIVDNGSRDEETLACYETLKQEHRQLRIISFKEEASHQALTNFGAKNAAGDYLLLLDPHTRMLSKNCIGELLGYCMRKDVGAVGAKLLYEDETICHAGMILGLGKTAGYIFRGKSRYAVGYESRIICAQDFSAVSTACILVKHTVYEEVGGMAEEFTGSFCDIDFGLKIRGLGLLVVYNPHAELFYCVPKTKGLSVNAKTTESDDQETKLLKKWGTVIESGDPYYNPNFSVNKLDFSIRS